MAHKQGSVMISLSHFQEFDCGEEVVQNEEGLDLVSGDTFYWYCGQFDGVARVLNYENGELEFKKFF